MVPLLARQGVQFFSLQKTVILTFDDEGGKTRYTARVRHWTAADRQAHEKMGFHEGRGRCADQLAAVLAKL
jgi:uncharacterized protein YndB with AHSA1/START domain